MEGAFNWKTQYIVWGYVSQVAMEKYTESFI